MFLWKEMIIRQGGQESTEDTSGRRWSSAPWRRQDTINISSSLLLSLVLGSRSWRIQSCLAGDSKTRVTPKTGAESFRNYSPFLCYLLLLTRYYIILLSSYYYFLHFEHASDSFSLLINSSWLLVFAIILFVTTIINLGCLIFFSYHFWCRDLLRELDKKYEVLLIIFFLLFGGVLVSEALLFVSFFWTSFHSLSSTPLGIISHEAFYLPDPCELIFIH